MATTSPACRLACFIGRVASLLCRVASLIGRIASHAGRVVCLVGGIASHACRVACFLGRFASPLCRVASNLSGLAREAPTIASLMGASESNATRAVLVALALATVGGCRACKSEPALRLTYEVDVAHAYAGTGDPAKVMETARTVLALRLDELGARATVTARGQELVVELAALDAEDLRIVKGVLAESGRLELKMADDGGSLALFGGLTESALPLDEGIAVVAERVPAGLDAEGHKRDTSTSYARVACKPPKHAAETMGDCLVRFRAWAATLPVPAGHG